MASRNSGHSHGRSGDNGSRGLCCLRYYAQAIAVRLTNRRAVVNIASRFTNRRFAFAVAVISVLAAKTIHILTHVTALSRVHLLRWGYSFFAQDLGILILIRLLLDSWVSSVVWPIRALATLGATLLLSIVIALGVINVSFFVVSGSEIHWRNIGLAGDAGSWSLFLSGMFSMSVVVCMTVVAGWLLQDALFALFGVATDLIKWPLKPILKCIPGVSCLAARSTVYNKVPQRDVEWAEKNASEDNTTLSLGTIKSEISASNWRPFIKPLFYLFIACALAAQVILFFIRPHESSLIFMSWTSAILPFVDFSNSSPNLDRLESVYGTNIGHSWDNRTAVGSNPPPSWMPVEEANELKFWRHYNNGKHYNATNDPLKISNVEEELLPDLRKILSDVPIRHVFFIFLESTRKDVFPLKKDGLVWRKLAESFEDGKLPQAAREKLEKLTPNANYITGDYDDGFDHGSGQKKRRGGINFNNVYAAGTYTYKSLIAGLCGAAPLIADFNLDVRHKLDQPCVPQIFDLLNLMNGKLTDDKRSTTRKFTSQKWHVPFMQSVTMHFDKQDRLLYKMGYKPENVVSQEYLQGKEGMAPKFGVVDLPPVNYFGMQEDPLEDYIRDAFESAKKNDERLFLSHITSTSHHPFGLPETETYVPLARGLEDFSRYVNTIGYDDKWLGRVLGMLDDMGVADETLVVMVGDHGLSLPENNMASAYYNPNVGNVHVPLVLSHPKLPSINIDDAVSSMQILPTILDLLMETGSLSESNKQVAHDLMKNYHGQSMIRKLLKTNNETGQGDWQFTVINPGRAMISTRDARQPHLRLVVPVIDNIAWRFTDLKSDPTEDHAVSGFDFVSFLRDVERKHGIETAKWVEEAAFISRWWVEDNSKRWRYGPHNRGEMD